MTSPTNMSDIARVLDALHFAADKHRDQRRKDVNASPYINHPIALAQVLTEVGQVHDVHVLQAAILHDTIEDTKTTYEELSARFGTEVADIVAEVTDDKKLGKDERKRLQVEHAQHKSRAAAMVKLADKICNLRDLASSPPHDWPPARKAEYFAWAKRVVDGLPKVNRRLEEEFQRVWEAGSCGGVLLEPARSGGEPWQGPAEGAESWRLVTRLQDV